MRIIVQMYLFGFILHCSGRSVLHSLDLVNYLFRDPCDMIPNIYRCFVFRFMYNFGMWLTTCTAIPLIIERSVATCFRDQYEKKYKWFGFALAAFQIGLASFPIYLAYSNTAFDGVFMPYCSVYKPGHPDIANFNSAVAIISQFIARIIFGYLFYANKNYRIKLQRSSLSTRYQVEQIKKSTQCLKIYANISTIFLIAQISSFSYLLSVAPSMARENYLALMELNSQFPAYGIITVVLVTRKLSSVRNQINTNLNSQVNLDGKETYFEILNKQIGPIKTKY
uniref:Serpentine Receptor, class T n=1 Tax=Caenorhabditis tropicalis TaxID=1561998 RepID=A0A1I7U9D9_9PELO